MLSNFHTLSPTLTKLRSSTCFVFLSVFAEILQSSRSCLWLVFVAQAARVGSTRGSSVHKTQRHTFECGSHWAAFDYVANLHVSCRRKDRDGESKKKPQKTKDNMACSITSSLFESYVTVCTPTIGLEWWTIRFFLIFYSRFVTWTG